MMILNLKGYRLDVKLVKCVHRCTASSATGKTAMAKIALSDVAYSGTVKLCNRQADYDSLLKNGYIQESNEILLLDRFDLFANDELWKFIEKHSSDCILVDAKNTWLADVPYLDVFHTITIDKLTVRDNKTRER